MRHLSSRYNPGFLKARPVFATDRHPVTVAEPQKEFVRSLTLDLDDGGPRHPMGPVRTISLNRLHLADRVGESETQNLGAFGRDHLDIVITGAQSQNIADIFLG